MIYAELSGIEEREKELSAYLSAGEIGELLAQYILKFDEKYEAGKAYAYVYPGMNRVLQAGGRVIRREEDRGVIVLIDDRFSDPLYKKSIPALWRGLKFVGDAKGLKMLLDKFWAEDSVQKS